jgi:hypothetical protein
MKKTITLLLILVLTLGLFAGCRNGTTPEDMATTASEALDDMTPKRDNANPTDGDGFIGGGNDNNGNNGTPGNGGMMPNGSGMMSHD